MTSKAGYWIGGGLIAFSVVGAILWGVLGFMKIVDTVDDFQRVPIPATRTVSLADGKSIIYVEGPRADDVTPPVRVSITDPQTERNLPIASYGGSLTYTFDTTGSAVATVTTPRAGRYVVRTQGELADAYEVAIGESVAGKIVAAILGAFLVGGMLALSGTGLIVATSIRRSRRRKAEQQGPPSPFGT